MEFDPPVDAAEEERYRAFAAEVSQLDQVGGWDQSPERMSPALVKLGALRSENPGFAARFDTEREAWFREQAEARGTGIPARRTPFGDIIIASI